MNPLFPGEIKDGKIKLDYVRDFRKHLASLEGKKIQIIIRRHKTSRSLKQNAYYFGVIVPMIADYVGESDKEAIHEALKEKFQKVRTDKGLKIVESTTKLTTIGFENYLSKIKRWASEDCGLVIPEPNEISVERP